MFSPATDRLGLLPPIKYTTAPITSIVIIIDIVSVGPFSIPELIFLTPRNVFGKPLVSFPQNSPVRQSL